MKNKRTHTAEFKTKVVLEALQERSSISELAQKWGLHPKVIGIWKKQFTEKAASIFAETSKADSGRSEEDMQALYAQIGQLKVENDYLKKVSARLGVSPKGGKW